MAVPSAGVIQAAAQCYGVAPARLQPLRDGANFVYAYQDADHERILRLTPATLGRRASIEGEIAWIDYLAQSGVRVPSVIRSVAGRLVEEICTPALETDVRAGAQEPPCYMAVVFRRAQGNHPEGKQLTDALLHQWGRALGHLHRVGKAYRPPNPALRRPHWHELEAFDLLARIPAVETEVRARCRQMLDKIHTLPVDKTGYGLIHADPEPWNILVHNDALTLIDFEESCYCWYAFDLAVSILYASIASTMGEPARDPANEEKDAVAAFAWHAWPILLAGYGQEHHLPAFWLDQMPTFLRLRVLQDYAFHLSHWDMANLVDWQQDVLAWQRRIILEDLPVLEVGWHVHGA